MVLVFRHAQRWQEYLAIAGFGISTASETLSNHENNRVGYELSLLPAHRCHYFFHAPSPLSTRDCSILKDCETGDRHGNTFPYRHVSCSLHSSEKYFTQKAAYVSK
jgi:hypothetical protein